MSICTKRSPSPTPFPFLITYRSPILLLSSAEMISFTSPALFILLSCVFQHFTRAVSLASTGQTLVLNGIPYYVPATPFTTIPIIKPLKSAASAGSLVPVTVVGLSASNATLSGLEQAVDGFSVDDVWNEGFLEGTWMFEVLSFPQNVHYRSHNKVRFK